MLRDLGTIAYWAITRGHKGYTREEFDDTPCGVAELVDAMDVIAGQTGLYRQAKPGDKPAGEAPGNSQTGAP